MTADWRRSPRLVEVPRDQWPVIPGEASVRLRVFASRDYLVQVFHEPLPAVARLSICRTSRKGDRWADGITWDELQAIKDQCGYRDADAVELYPRRVDVVNEANMRHLWVMADPVPMAWRSEG